MKIAGALRCCAAVAGLLAIAAPAAAQETITVGIYAATSDAPLFIADKKGYFRDEGIAVKLTSFQSAAMMVPPLGTGQLDVGAGSASAGLYNAVARGIKIRIVADKASSPPGYGGTKLLVRKDHVDSGRYKTLKDLKDMKFATNAPGREQHLDAQRRVEVCWPEVLGCRHRRLRFTDGPCRRSEEQIR